MFSGCEKCYETPCTCGRGYASLTSEQLEEQIKLLQGLLEKKKAAAGQVWVTTRGRYVYLLELSSEKLGFIWYSEPTGKLDITEVHNQLDKITNLTFVEWAEWVQDKMDEQERLDDQEGN